jgi:flagellar protein FlaG
MSDVNLNSPDLQLVHSSERAPARASSSPRAEGKSPSAQAPVTALTETQEPTRVERLEQNRESQREELNNAVSRLNDFVQTVQRDLQFDVDDATGKSVVRVMDQQTNEVIRQIPDELVLRLAENLQQKEPLTLLNIKV